MKSEGSGARAMGLLLAVFLCASMGCSLVIKRVTEPTIAAISQAAMEQDDLELVRLGAPGYLIMIDGLVARSPDDPFLLAAAARLYSAYASAFVLGIDEQRAKKMTKKARDYAIRAVAVKNRRFAALWDKPYAKFEAVAGTFKRGDVDQLYLLTSTWAGYIQAYRDDWDALADLPKIKLLAERLQVLDETYYYGAAHLVLGVLDTLLPPSAGGKPEEGRHHFERALAIAKGRFLPAYVLYAKQYARMVGDRELYIKLLNQVEKTPADVVPRLTLINTVAKQEAHQLLKQTNDYF